MKTYWIDITPKIASDWLKANTRNRRIKESHVRFLAREMELGRWAENGETIKKNGDLLLDGQHRLLACVRSNTSFRTLVVEGLSEEAFNTIDTNVPRSGSDTLSVQGEKNTSRLSAALGFVHRYLTGTVGAQWTKLSNLEIQQLLEQHPGIRNSTNRSEFNTRLIPVSILSACHYLFSQKDPALADIFVGKLLKGSGLTEGEPVYVLRERLVQNSLAKAKLHPDYISALLIKTWNHTRAGTQVKILHFRNQGESIEVFPLVR
jgi:hypothetical protein